MLRIPPPFVSILPLDLVVEFPLNVQFLIVGDALFGLYRMGPFGEPEFVYNGLIVGTDPVAVDHQARLIIENEKRKNNVPIVPSLHIDHAIKLGLGAPIEEIKVTPINRTAKG